MKDLRTMLAGSPYQGYSYSYPHKTAYRRFDQPLPLTALWAGERTEALFLYIHIPFCEMRCGFCNLFTQAMPEKTLVESYLAALQKQARQVRGALGAASFARLAIGGGTPSFLEPEQIDGVLDVAGELIGARLGEIPISIEVSPGTVTAEKLDVMARRGTTRVSIGIESFVEAESCAVNRPQQTVVVERALELLRASGIPNLNVDLIYGLPGQSVASWLASLRSALAHTPEELYLYPLYVRPETTLGRAGRSWDDLRLSCYREGRALLLDQGYTQVSMRMFVAPGRAPENGPVYHCQEDGMVGLGCGARSYTANLHYSNDYAVRARGVRAIINDFVSSSDASFSMAAHGYRLPPDDQHRRFVIQSLLCGEGFSFSNYTRWFDSNMRTDLPQIDDLIDLGLACEIQDGLVLTEQGVERSDVLGPWLYSDTVRTLMEEYRWR
jgi:oxygen-independent coproporphyrinogen III oxidase